ncbi:MAG: tetratricopeptide repeat protein [Treponema sp.]|nr:tetratricopeptide repeat protein [Treponema sp.]
MIRMFFSLRFQSQLKRTRPKLLRQLEKSIVETTENFGGEFKAEHKLIGASFDDTGIGVVIDMLCVLENIGKALEKASSELYGHICVLGRDVDEEDAQVLARGLPSDLWGTGIWCDPEIRKSLEPFVDFDDPLSPPDYQKPFSGYAQVKKIREHLAAENGEKNSRNDNSEKISQYLKQGALRNTVIVGAEFIGKREGLYRYCAGNMGDFPPLIIRFGHGSAVTCAADALTPDIERILASGDAGKLAEMAELLFRERLREEVSDFLVKQGEKFFRSLTEAYKAAADRAKVHPVVVLENLQTSGSHARRIISDVYQPVHSLNTPYFYGTCTDMKSLKPWEEVFPRIIKFSPEKKNRPSLPNIPPDLWEIAYACALFSRYFPGHLISRLFVEEGKNPAMIEKTLAILSSLHLTGGLSNPSPRFPNLVSRAENILGERAERIRKIVRNRLMAWVDSGKVKPCFRLLEALAALGGEAGEALMIEAVCGDVINGTFGGMEKAIEDGSLASIVGENRAGPLACIFRAQKALCWGSREEIVKTFAESFPVNALHPYFRIRVLESQTSYHLGVCDIDAAAALAKEAMLVAQEESGWDMARIYRLFSLVNFANGQLPDAIDYSAFAAEEAEKTGNTAELVLIDYYSAAAYFIFGNISKAERLARQAEEAALAAGRPDWADRCWFLRGRLRFETGRYQEALDIFKSLETDYYGSAPEGFAQTVAAWIYRSNVYLRNTHSGGKISETGESYDARLFEMEEACFSGDYRKILELAADQNSTVTKDRFLYIEQPDWRSGFAQCELMIFPMKDLRDRMFFTCRAMALCNLADGEQGEKEKAIREMRRVIKDDLPNMDPNDAFYFYSYYRILKRSGASEVDMNTAISLAFKRLQRRASRIDDNQTKRAFLSFHYWNGALEAVAKEHKLI